MLPGADRAILLEATNAMKPTTPLTESDIALLVDRFYEKVRRDPALGSVFNPVVHDWDEHKATLVSFWSSVALRAGSYRGNPMAMHRAHAISSAHFDRWLALWRETSFQVLDAEHAAEFCRHADSIARSLKYGLGLDPHRRPLGLPLAGRDP